MSSANQDSDNASDDGDFQPQLPDQATGPVVKTVPRPEEWESVHLDQNFTWDMEATRPQFFDWLSLRFSDFLKTLNIDGGQAQKRANFLRSKVPHERRSLSRRKARQAPDWMFDDEWTAHRFLGAGGFGHVGLWVHKDENGVIDDEVAVKESAYEEILAWSPQNRYLAKEAVIQTFLNESSAENILQLRRFKHLIYTAPDAPNPNPAKDEHRRFRFYLEYAPHGDLHRLITRYRAWDQYLPETFLWHVFDSLAKAAVVLAEHTPRPSQLPDHVKGRVKRDFSTIHFDLKPENIFLGYEEPFSDASQTLGGITRIDQKQRKFYPIIKLADFGISEFVGTTKNDKSNPADLWGLGTDCYKAPEMMHYGITFSNPPNGKAVELEDQLGNIIDVVKERKENKHESGIEFGQPTNIWNIGKVMYDLATLSRRWHYAYLSTRFSSEYEKFGKNAIKNFDIVPFTYSNKAKAEMSDDEYTCPYSKELTDLIYSCMRPRMKDRITATDLRAKTHEQLLKSVTDGDYDDNNDGGIGKGVDDDQSHNGGKTTDQSLNAKQTSKGKGGTPSEKGDPNHGVTTPPEGWRVFYKGNKINQMNPGAEDFKVYHNDSNEVKCGVQPEELVGLLEENLDPDWNELQLPSVKWAPFLSEWRARKARTAGETPNNDYWDHMVSQKSNAIEFKPQKLKFPPKAGVNQNPTDANAGNPNASGEDTSTTPSAVPGPDQPKANPAGKGKVKPGPEASAPAPLAPAPSSATSSASPPPVPAPAPLGPPKPPQAAKGQKRKTPPAPPPGRKQPARAAKKQKQ